MLFENPFWFLVGMAFLEVILLAVWYERRTRRAACLLVVPAALAVVVWLTSVLVVTDREQMIRTVGLIGQDLAAGKTQALREYLGDGVIVNLGPYGGDRLDKAATIGAAEAAAEQYKISSVRVSRFELEMRKHPVSEIITVMTSDSDESVLKSTPLEWRVWWVKRGVVWRIAEVHPPRIHRPGQ